MFIGFRIPWKLVVPAIIGLGVLFHTQITDALHLMGF